MAHMDEQSIANAVEVMKLGMMNRYQMDAGASTNYLLQTEQALSRYLGVKYTLGLNSGGSAIFLALKCAELETGAPVLSNAFTFNAVPSAIAHAGGRTVLVECTDTMVVDLEDLERKAVATGSKHLVLSYMRGRIPDMDKVLELCERLGLHLIEDAAHAYGCEWKGRKIGTFGCSSTLSTQANKIMNSGEGGFLCTNDDETMAKAIISAGCYEELFLKHCDLCPPKELLLKYRMTCVNYSIRMTNLQGALLLPQVSQIDVRREKHNTVYAVLSKRLEEHPRITVPSQLPEVTPVLDSIQFTVAGLQPEQVRAFQKRVKELGGFKLEAFGLLENARNWRTWRFLEEIDLVSLPQTDECIACTFDTRLHFDMSMEEVEKMAYTMHCALEEVLLAEDPPIVSDSMSEVHKTRSLQVSEKTVGVKLSNLPKTLCNRSHLEVAIEQAGLESKVKAFELSSESAATAFLALESEAAAQQCIKHFSGRQWTGSATPLCARYCKDATTVLSMAHDPSGYPSSFITWGAKMCQ